MEHSKLAAHTSPSWRYSQCSQAVHVYAFWGVAWREGVGFFLGWILSKSSLIFSSVTNTKYFYFIKKLINRLVYKMSKLHKNCIQWVQNAIWTKIKEKRWIFWLLRTTNDKWPKLLSKWLLIFCQCIEWLNSRTHNFYQITKIHVCMSQTCST